MPDPTNMVTMGAAIADRLGTLAPAGASAFAANQKAFDADMTALDTAWSEGTATCTNRDLVVLGVLPTLFDARTNHSRAVLADINDRYGLDILGPAIPRSIRSSTSIARRRPRRKCRGSPGSLLNLLRTAPAPSRFFRR
mgnify:CR=1 FL=1